MMIIMMTIRMRIVKVDEDDADAPPPRKTFQTQDSWR